MSIVKKAYRGVYRHMPLPAKSMLSRLAFRLPNKPSVLKSDVPWENRFPEQRAGGLVISADFEMAWAWRYSKGKQDANAIGLHERENIPGLIRLFEQFNVPITWATVGHLFLDQCHREGGRAHGELERIPHFTNRVWAYESGDWYDADPCSDVLSAPAWYASDLIDAIQASSVDHEIGCHTYTHIDCTDRHCPPQVMEDEISACVDLARARNIKLSSMVFPGGTNGNYAVLAKAGFTNYRINAPWDLFYPYCDEYGLWALPSSATIENVGFGWSADYYAWRFIQFIDEAISTGTVAHLWFHPSFDAFCLNEVFPRVLEYATKKEADGDLWIGTMEDMAAHCAASAKI